MNVAHFIHPFQLTKKSYLCEDGSLLSFLIPHQKVIPEETWIDSGPSGRLVPPSPVGQI